MKSISIAFKSPLLECVMCSYSYIYRFGICCRYGEITAWTGKPTVKVAVTVDAPAVVEMIMQRLTTDD
jgi:hypothetical protein